MKKIMNYVKSFVIAAMVLTSGNVWGETNQLIVTTNGFSYSGKVCTLWGAHCTFRLNSNNDLKSSNGNLKLSDNTSMTLTWERNAPTGYTITVNAVSITVTKDWNFGDRTFQIYSTEDATKKDSHKFSGNDSGDGEKVTLGISGLNYGVDKSGVVVMKGDGVTWYISNITIAYTVTPNVPTIVLGQESHSIMAAIPGGENQEVDLNGLFSRVDASHTSLEYECNSANSANARISNGVFSATEAGDYTVRARIVAQANCHEASAWSSDVTIHVAPRASKIAPEISNTFSTYYVEDASIDLRDLWTSTSDGAITYSLVSFTPLANAVHTGATAPSLTDGYLLSLGQAGTVRLSLHQEEGTSHLALENDAIYDFVISKRTPIISWSDEPIYFNGTYENIYTITAGDPTLFSIVSSDTEVATVAGTILTTYNKNASTTLTVTTTENYKWAEGIFEKVVTPATAPIHLPLAMNNETQFNVNKSWMTGNVIWNQDKNGIRFCTGGAIDYNSHEYDLHFEGIPDKLSFSTESSSGVSSCTYKVYESVDGSNWGEAIWESTGRNNTVDKSLKKTTRYVKLHFNGNYYAYMKNITITELQKFESDKNSLNFATNQKDHAPAVQSFVLTHANAGYVTTVTAPDHYAVSLEENGTYTPSINLSTQSTKVTGGDIYGTKTIYVKYLADADGTHNANVTISNDLRETINVAVSGVTQGKLATHIEYIGAASYAVNADNMSATELFRVVDVNGDEVATPVLTLATSDAEKINVVSDAHAIDFLCGGSATITASYAGDETYAAAANVEQAIEVTRLTTDAFTWSAIAESYEVETEIPSLATTNSGLAVTYTSDNEAVIKIVDGKITTIGKGSAVLTAHTAGDCTWAAINSEGKTINVHPHEQYIDWNQSFIDIVKNGDDFSKQDIALDALAKDMTGNNTDVNITYSVPTDNGVATITDNTLHLIGDGTITITATTADDSKYATVSITKEVRVRVYGSKCDSYLPVTGGTQKADGNNEKVWTWDNPTGDLVAPGTKNVTFHASVSALMAGRSLTVSQKIGEDWIVITDRDKAPDSGSSKTIGCTVATNATGLKVQYTGTGWGSCTVSDVLVPMNSYIATVDASSFTGSAVAYNEITTNAVTIKYADVPLIEYEITDFTNETDDNTLDASSLTVTPVSRADLSNDCGDYGTYSFVISGTFNKVGAITANLRLHTSANDELKIPITLTINPATRTIHWDSEHTENVPAYTTYDLDAYCTTANENPAGDVHYEITSDGDNATIENGILTFIKPGLVTVTATPVENTEYSDPVDSKVVRSWSVQQRKAEVTILEGFVKKEFTYMDVRSASDFDLTKYEAKDEVSKATVSGTLSYVDEGTNYISITGQQVKFTFTPSDDAVYNPVTIYVPVTVNPATPSVTFPTTMATTYEAGMKLDNINLIGGSATFNGDVEGSFAWKEPTTAIGVVNSGSAYTVVFTPNSSNFKSVEGEAEIRITKATPEVTFPTTASIKLADGLTLESVALVGGTASVAGKFAWDVPTTVLAEGTNSYSVTFTPTDAANYNTAVSTVSVTVLPAKIIYDGTNWSHTPAAGDDVLISGDLVIDTDLKVNGMTIDNGVKVTLTVNGSLTVNGASDTQANYGDLIINAGGQVVLNDAANLQVRNLELNTELGNRETAAKSSQVSNAEKLHINGNAYIDITFDPVKITKGYYDFTVPFPVEAANGIYAVLGDSEKKLRQGTDYLLQNFSESLRATNVTAWKNFTGVLNPGKGYTIAINANHPEWNTIRFKKTSMSAIPDVREITLSVSASGNAEDKGWNCLGNGSLTHAQLEAEGISKLQIYDHTTNTYATFDLNTYNFAVGTTFRVQATSNGSVLYCNEVSNVVELRAPNRTPRENSEYCLQLTKEETMLDQIFLSASDDALNSYEIGHDLRKEGNPTSATICQMWSTAYNNQLSVVELPFEGNQAEFPISIFTPADGVYNLQVAQAISDQQLYLTQNGYPIWNLSASPYSLYLMQGTTNEYGLLIVSSPKVATDVNGIFGAEQAEKIIFNNQVYILRNGMIFDATGKKL